MRGVGESWRENNAGTNKKTMKPKHTPLTEEQIQQMMIILVQGLLSSGHYSRTAENEAPYIIIAGESSEYLYKVVEDAVYLLDDIRIACKTEAEMDKSNCDYLNQRPESEL
jgi:hypothetical protein